MFSLDNFTNFLGIGVVNLSADDVWVPIQIIIC